MLAYYLKAEPHLFKEVIERQLGVLAAEKEAKLQANHEADEAAKANAATSSMDIALYKCGAVESVVLPPVMRPCGVL